MRSGRLDRRIAIQRKTITQNTYGEEIVAWSTVATVWAELRYNSGGERYAENQYQGKTTTTFRVRWSEAAKATTVEDQIFFDARYYDVTDVREIGRREGLEIDAYVRSETQVAGGG